MKALICTILMLAGSIASARAVERDIRPDSAKPAVDKVVEAFNIIYPDLSLSVQAPVQEDLALRELEVLRATLHGGAYKKGGLLQLACNHPACGGDNGRR
jgi:hypothetical protein